MALRWILGITAALLGGGWLVLAVLGDGFRRSFGASENGPLVVLLPVLVGAILVASVIWPGQRLLLHGTAIVVAALAAGAVWLAATETPFVGISGLIYCGLWAMFYWRAL